MDMYLDQPAIDTTTPASKLMLQVTRGFAEFERSMIRQLVRAGLKRAVEGGGPRAWSWHKHRTACRPQNARKTSE